MTFIREDREIYLTDSEKKTDAENGLVPLFLKNKILIFYVPCSPKLPVFPCSFYFRPLFPCSPEKIVVVALFPKTPGRASVIYIAGDLLPLSTVDSDNFKYLMERAEPRYQLPSRTFLTSKLLHEKSTEVKNNLKSQLKKAPCICLTIDLWSILIFYVVNNFDVSNKK